MHTSKQPGESGESELDSQKILSDIVNQHLESSRLSLRQISKRWGMTSSMLSQLRNQKKNVGLNLGLKILRECGADIEVQKSWLQEELKRNSSEYENFLEDLSENRKFQNIEKEGAKFLRSDLKKINLFLDIESMGEKGLSANGIFKYHGINGQKWARKMSELGLVEKNSERYYIKKMNSWFVSDKETTHLVVTKILENQREKYVYEGDSLVNYFIGDVPEGVYEDLKELYLDFKKQVRTMIGNSEASRIKEGKRVAVSMSLGELE
jgi:transcriptional regulator with XRE-family HTH domain